MESSGNGGSSNGGMSKGGSVSYGNGSGSSDGRGGVGNGDGSSVSYSGDGSNGSVGGGVGGVVDNGLLNNLMDGVHLVGGGHGHGTGNLNGVGLGHLLGNNNLTLNGDGHLDGDINVVLVDLELGDNVGLDGGDSGVSSHGGKDLLLGDGVSRGGAKVDGGRGDSSSIGGDSGDGGRREGLGLNNGLGLTGNIAVGRLGNDLLVGLDILVARLDTLGTDLDGLVADNAVLNMLLNNGGSGSIGVVGLANGNGSSGDGSNGGSSVDSSDGGSGVDSGDGGSGMGNGYGSSGMHGGQGSGSIAVTSISIGIRGRGAIHTRGEGKCDLQIRRFDLHDLIFALHIVNCFNNEKLDNHFSVISI